MINHDAGMQTMFASSDVVSGSAVSKSGDLGTFNLVQPGDQLLATAGACLAYPY